MSVASVLCLSLHTCEIVYVANMLLAPAAVEVQA